MFAASTSIAVVEFKSAWQVPSYWILCATVMEWHLASRTDIRVASVYSRPPVEGSPCQRQLYLSVTAHHLFTYSLSCYLNRLYRCLFQCLGHSGFDI